MILGSLKNVRVIRLPRRDAWLFFQIHPGDRRLKLAPRIGGMKNCPYWGIEQAANLMVIWRVFSLLIVLDVFKEIFYGLYHGKSPSNHHVGEYVWNFFQVS